jgi:hypothetical protein
MPDNVTADHLRTLVALYRSYLRRAEAVVELSALGPLAGELFTDGHWRRSWPARARRLLAAALEAHVGGLDGTPRAPRVHAAIGAWWGVSEFPIETYELLSDRTGMSTKQLGRWERDALADVAGHGAMARITRDAPQPSGTRHTNVWEPPAGEWPPTEFQLSLLSGLDRQHEIDSSRREDALRLLRAAAAQWLMEYLQPTEHSQLYRQLSHTIVRPWKSEDRLWLTPDPAAHDDGEYTRSLGAAAHVAFYELVLDREHADRIQLLLGERHGIDQMIKEVVNRNVAEMQLIRVSGALGKRVTQMIVGERLDTQPAFVQHVDPSMLDDESPTDRFTGATAFAEANRMRKAAVTERPERARQYVARRIGYRPSDKGNPLLDSARESGLSRRKRTDESDLALLALADQAVHLMVLDLVDVDLLRDLSHAIQQSPTPSEYQPLTTRDRGLLYSKLRSFGPALTYILAARSELADLAGEGTPYDRKSLLESGQQIQLSAGGVCVSVIEDMLTARDDQPDEGTLDFARAALAWSAGALAGLAAIKETNSLVAGGAAPGLNVERYGDFHISWVNWEVKSRQQQLRAQIAVRALIEAGLLTESALGPGPYDCSLDTIEKSFRTLITLPSIGQDDVLGIAIQGIWIAMLRGGAVPVEYNTAPILRDLGPLDVTPDSIAKHRTRFTVLGAGETVLWLKRMGYKPGVLGYLPPGGPMATALHRTSGQLFKEFQESLGAPVLPDRPGSAPVRRD